MLMIAPSDETRCTRDNDQHGADDGGAVPLPDHFQSIAAKVFVYFAKNIAHMAVSGQAAPVRPHACGFGRIPDAPVEVKAAIRGTGLGRYFRSSLPGLHVYFHLIEQPMLGICSAGPCPVAAIRTIASNNSRWAFGTGCTFDASSRPRY